MASDRCYVFDANAIVSALLLPKSIPRLHYHERFARNLECSLAHEVEDVEGTISLKISLPELVGNRATTSTSIGPTPCVHVITIPELIAVSGRRSGNVKSQVGCLAQFNDVVAIIEGRGWNDVIIPFQADRLVPVHQHTVDPHIDRAFSRSPAVSCRMEQEPVLAIESES